MLHGQKNIKLFKNLLKTEMHYCRWVFLSLFILMQLTFWIIFINHKAWFCLGEDVSGQNNRMLTNEVTFFWRHPYIVRRLGCALLFCVTSCSENAGVKS
jgi:hypothetical protein